MGLAGWIQTWPLIPNYDHTYLNDTTRGYYMALDPNSGMRGKVIYELPISGLCDSTELNLSFWAANINSYMPDEPSFYFQMVDSVTKKVFIQSGICTLPLIPTGVVWKQFGMPFTSASGNTYLFRIILQNEGSGNGNDWGVDDIKVVYCGGIISQTSPANAENHLCTGDSLKMSFSVDFSDGRDHSLANYQWQKTTTPLVESSWTNISGATNLNYSLDSVTTFNIGCYRIIVVEGGGGCSIKPSNYITVNVYSAFTAGSITSSTQSVCTGTGSIIVNNATAASGGNGAISYQWYRDGTVISGATSNSLSYDYSSLAAGTYTFTRKAKDNTCSGGYQTSTGQFTLTVNSKPSVSISGNSAICSGKSTTLTASPSGASSYSWSPSTGLSANTGATVTASPTATTTYTVTVTNSNGCKKTDTHTLTVNDNPSVAISGDLSICEGESTTLTATPSGASYLWSNSTTNASISTSTSLTAGTYSYAVTVTNAESCTSTASATVSIDNVTVSASVLHATVYEGESNSVSVTATGGTTPYSYSWKLDGGTAQVTTTNSLSIPTNLSVGNHTYTVTVTDNNGCMATATANFEVLVLIDINDFAISICSGESFSITPVNGTDGIVPAGTTYSWSAPTATYVTGMSAGSDQNSISNTLTNSSTTNQTVTYTVTPENGTVIGHTFEIAVTVYAPITGGSITATTVTCALDTIKQLDNQTEGNGGDLSNYTWAYSTNGGITWDTLSGVAYNVNGMIPDYGSFLGQAIFLRIYNTTSCGTAGTNQITLTNPGNVGSGSITSSSANPSYFCSGDAVSIKLKANPYIQSGSTNYTIQWQSSIDGGTTYYDIGSASTDTTYTYTNAAITAPIIFRYIFTLTGCSSLPSNNTFVINIYENPSITLSTTASCPNQGSYTVEATVTGGATPYSYTWTGATGTDATGTVTQVGATDCGHIYTASLTLTDNHNCSVTKDKSFTVNDTENPTIMGTLKDLTVEGCVATEAPTAVTTVSALEAMREGASFTISDNCTATADLTVTASDASTGICPIQVTRTYTITDKCGNNNTITQIIHVDDNTAPSITCPVDISQNTDAAQNYATITMADIIGTDNWSGTVSITNNSAYATVGNENASGQYPIGITTVTYIAKDFCNNEKNCSFDIVVSDKEAPVIICQANQAVCPAIATSTYTHSGIAWNATATDNVGVNSLTYAISGATNVVNAPNTTLDGQVFNIGATIVTWTAIDAAGNISTCTHTITVNPMPVIAAQTPDAICDGGSISLDATTFAGSNTIPTGTLYTWEVIDNANVSGETSNTIPAATFTTGALNNTSTATQILVYTVTPISGDGCKGADFTITVIVNPTAVVNDIMDQVVCNGSATTAVSFGTTNIGGTVTYTWTNDDSSIGLAASGTENIASFTAMNTSANPVTATITVTPTFTNGGISCIGPSKNFTITVNPIISLTNSVFTCPADLDITLSYGSCDTVPYLGVPTFTTNITIPDFVTSCDTTNDAPAIFSVGTTIVTWKITDLCDSFLTCKQRVTVKFPPCGYDSLTHTMFYANIDNYNYPTVRVGCHCWTAENLHNTHYSNNDSILESTYYNNDIALLSEYGRLYSWYATVRADAVGNPTFNVDGYVQGVCPAGWAVPSVMDYTQLVMDAPGADMLKSADPKYWLGLYGGIIPNSGFDALPAGYYDNSTNHYYNLLGETHFWTTDEATYAYEAICSSLYYYCIDLLYEKRNKGYGYSVRCIKK